MKPYGGQDDLFGQLRFLVFGALICFAMFVLVARLYWLQVVRGEEFKIKSESNFVQLRRVMHDRGAILDRAGRVLVDNRPAHDVYVTPAFVPDARRTLAKIGAILQLDQATIIDLVKVLDRAQQGGLSSPLPVASKTAPERAMELRRYIENERLLGIDIMADDRCPGCQMVVVDPTQFQSTELVFHRLATALGLDREELATSQLKVEHARGLERFRPIRVARDVTWQAFVAIDTAASLMELPGVDTQHTQQRRYRYSAMAAHVLGYINEVSSEQLKQLTQDGYRMGDFIGRAGIERTFERELRGIDGVERVVVDAKGRRMDETRARFLLEEDRGDPPQPGHTLVLSLDAELQRVAEESFGLMEAVAGAAVAVDVRTGFILALASVPDYDPNVVSGRIPKEVKRELDTNRLQPWFNKAVQQHYPPGSTFKVVTALAGLRSGKISLERTIHCPGAFSLGRATWRCWLRGGHGSVELNRAIQKSCDVYFYTVGFEAGIDALADAAHLFGYGSRSGIDLRRESPGIVGDRAYYSRRPDGYQKGYVINNSIGQGDISATPLQVALSYAAVANDGTLFTPQLVKEIRDHEGHVVHRFDPIARWQIPAPSGTWPALQSGLCAVLEPGGTGYGLHFRRNPPGLAEWMRTSGIKLAGKTGTAQVVKMGKVVKRAEELDYWERDHAWFAVYAPADDPEIAVAVINEHSGHGGSHAAPIAANIIKTYFELVHPRPKTDLESEPPPGAAPRRREVGARPNEDRAASRPAAPEVEQ